MGQQPGSDHSRKADDGRKTRSLTEWVTLALLVEGPVHGFALAKILAPGSDLGRILTVRRPLVYRALDRLVADGLAAPRQTEPGDAGPNRTVMAPTADGVAAVNRWLITPVDHVRELRVEFLVKLRLLERRGRSNRRLVVAQRAALDQTLTGLIDKEAPDVVDRWRAHNATAAALFLDELQLRGPGRAEKSRDR